MQSASGSRAPLSRAIAWGMLGALAAFLVNNVLSNGYAWPGAGAILRDGAGAQAWLQLAIYLGCIGLGAWLGLRRMGTPLRTDAARIAGFNAWLIRAAFWSVLLVGLVDAAISFVRVEGMLEAAVGADLAGQLGRSQFRGPWVHLPLVGLGILIALVTRTLGFTWLALLIVVAELGIVVSRFVFSYEQAFMGDLVRFWYAALFLFASAYTLLEDGHVRVDVFYAGMKSRTKGFVNAIGAIVLGMSVCWVILAIGMGGRNSIITAPVMNFEVSQSGFGMYVKYMMAAYLAIFAITMLIQFAAMLLEAVADLHDEPGAHSHEATQSA